MRLSLLCLLLPLSPLAAATDFDCKAKGLSRTERTVCRDPALLALDRDMQTSFRRALAEGKDRAALQANQQQWLQDKRDTCTSEYCLQLAYQTRTAELDGALGKGRPALVTPGDYRRADAASPDAATLRVGILADGSYQLTVAPAAAGSTLASPIQAGFVPQVGAASFLAGDCRLTMLFAPDFIAVSGASAGCSAGASLDGEYMRAAD